MPRLRDRPHPLRSKTQVWRRAVSVRRAPLRRIASGAIRVGGLFSEIRTEWRCASGIARRPAIADPVIRSCALCSRCRIARPARRYGSLRTATGGMLRLLRKRVRPATTATRKPPGRTIAASVGRPKARIKRTTCVARDAARTGTAPSPDRNSGPGPALRPRPAFASRRRSATARVGSSGSVCSSKPALIANCSIGSLSRRTKAWTRWMPEDSA